MTTALVVFKYIEDDEVTPAACRSRGLSAHLPDAHPPREEWRHAVYFVADGASTRYLYVGMSGQVGRRLRTHARERHWWPPRPWVLVFFCPCWRQALAVERLAILTCDPLYNVRSTPAWRDARAGTKRVAGVPVLAARELIV